MVSVGVFAGGTVAVVVVVWRVRIRVSSVAAVPLHAIKVSKMPKFWKKVCRVPCWRPVLSA